MAGCTPVAISVTVAAELVSARQVFFECLQFVLSSILDSLPSYMPTTLPLQKVVLTLQQVLPQMHSCLQKSCYFYPSTYVARNIYRTSSKNSAPLNIRHPSAESGQITSIFGEAIPKNFQIQSLFLCIFGTWLCTCELQSSQQFIEREMDAISGYSSTSKRQKLMDFFPEMPANEGPQQFSRFLRQYQPMDVPRCLARPNHSVGRPQSRSRADSQSPAVLTTSVDIAGQLAL